MSSRSKVERALHGPSLMEVTLGAFLSLILGAVLGAVYLMALPVETVRELPKEPRPGQVFYLEGQRNSGVRSSMMNKQKLLLGQGPMELKFNEAELNAWVAQSEAQPDPEAESGVLKPDSVNFRVRDGRLQIGLPSTVDLFGLYGQKLILQARGTFVRGGANFVFSAEEFLVGSLPVHRLPGATAVLLPRLLDTSGVPEELRAAWGRLENVRIDNDALVLTVP